MLIKTVLNNCHRFKSFVFSKVCFMEYQKRQIIRVTIIPRKNAKALCSICKKTTPLYDTLNNRYFEFIPI